MILVIGLEVSLESVDTFGKNGDLDLGGTRVLVIHPMFLYELVHLVSGDGHLSSVSPSRQSGGTRSLPGCFHLVKFHRTRKGTSEAHFPQGSGLLGVISPYAGSKEGNRLPTLVKST